MAILHKVMFTFQSICRIFTCHVFLVKEYAYKLFRSCCSGLKSCFTQVNTQVNQLILNIRWQLQIYGWYCSTVGSPKITLWVVLTFFWLAEGSLNFHVIKSPQKVFWARSIPFEERSYSGLSNFEIWRNVSILCVMPCCLYSCVFDCFS